MAEILPSSPGIRHAKEIVVGLGGKPLHLLDLGFIVPIPDEIGEVFREILSATGEGVVPQKLSGSLRLCRKQRLMLGGKSQRPVQEVAELMESGTGGRHIDAPLTIVRRPGAGGLVLLAQFRQVLVVHSEHPALGLEPLQDWLRHTAQLQ